MLNAQTNLLKRIVITSALALVIVVVPPLLATVTGHGASAYAAEWPKKPSKYEKKKRKTRFQAVSESFGKKLERIQKAIDQEDWAELKDILDGMRPRFEKYNKAEKISFLRSDVYYVYSIENAKADRDSSYNIKYNLVIDRYKKMLEYHESMSQSEIESILLQIASIYLNIGSQSEQRRDFQLALNYYHEWLALTKTVSPDQKFQIGYTHFFLKQPNKALEWVEEAIVDAQAAGRIPKEPWYNLQKYIYSEKQNQKKVAQILEIMVGYYPKANYWRELALTYAGLDRTTDSLVTLDSLYIQKALNSGSHLKSLAYKYYGLDAPFKAAQVLEWGMKQGHLEKNFDNLRWLSYALDQAGETKKAIQAMESAIDLSGDVVLMQRILGLYMNDRQYKKVIAMAKKARQKGLAKAKNPGSFDSSEGVALFYLKRYKESVAAFRRAAKYPKMKSNADNWARYVQGRIDDLKEIEENKKKLRQLLAEQ